MKCLVLDIPALIPQCVHDDLQILRASDVPGHAGVVASIEEDLAEEFERLSFGDVVWRQNERLIGCEELRRYR